MNTNERQHKLYVIQCNTALCVIEMMQIYTRIPSTGNLNEKKKNDTHRLAQSQIGEEVLQPLTTVRRVSDKSIIRLLTSIKHQHART